jgi:hypothetical protein
MRGKAILIAAAVVLVLAGGGAAAYVTTKDDDGGSPGEVALGQEPSQTQSDSSPAPAPTAPTETAPPDSTETETAPTPTSPSDPTPDQPSAQPNEATPDKSGRPPSNFSVPPAQKFSGTGNARLGTVDVKATSVLRWRAKGHFEVRFGRQAFSIIAPTKSGQLVIPAFRFDHVRVIARGRWTISVSPQT